MDKSTETQRNKAVTNYTQTAHKHMSGYFGTDMPQCAVEFGAVTDIGRRRTNNEDHYAILRRARARTVLSTSLPEGTIPDVEEFVYSIAVADGVGGHRSGEIASAMALQVAGELGVAEVKWPFRVNDREAEEIRAKMQVYGELIHHGLLRFADELADCKGMATTLTVAHIVGRNAFIGHVGDSRAYLLRNKYLMQLTEDHTLEFAADPTGAKASSSRSRLRSLLMNAIGIREGKLYVETNHVYLDNGDQLLLCTDGLTAMIPEDEIGKVISASETPQAACDTLLQLALEAGGKDNITICIGRFCFPD